MRPFSAAFTHLTSRGVFCESTPGLVAGIESLLSSPARPSHPVSAYAGFDPTAPSLHLGHVSVLMSLLRLQHAGLRPIALIGGATALIGDPTGKSADRPQLPREAVAANAASLRAQLLPLLGEGCLVVDNAAYYSSMDVLSFMREVGSHFRLSQLLARDSVRGRMGWSGTASEAAAPAAAAAGAAAPSASASASAGMSYTEFSYSLFQAYDFWELHKAHGAALQVGGSDQWGNITAGVELIRRLGAQQQQPATAHGAVVPLLTNSAGVKFGKSEAHSAPLWLDARLTTHHALWQYLQGVEDGAVLGLLRTLTLVGEEELAALEAGVREAPHRKAAQLRLADEVVGWLRGSEAVAAARRTAKLLFAGSAIWGGSSSSSEEEAGSSGSGSGAFMAQRAALPTLTHADLQSLAAADGVASATVPAPRALSGSFTVVDALVALGLVKSKGEGRRMVEGGGVYWNWERVKEARGLVEGDFVQGQSAVVNAGRKRSGVLLLAPQ